MSTLENLKLTDVIQKTKMPLNWLLSLQVYSCSCRCVGAVSDDVIFHLQVQACGIVCNDVIFVSPFIPGETKL